MKQPEGLLSVLLDRAAREDERMDAAMDLDEYDEPEVLEALVRVATTPGEDHGIVSLCGESIGMIWKRNKTFDQNIYIRLPNNAKSEINAILNPLTPEE